MIKFTAELPELLPSYQTAYASGADICAKDFIKIPPQAIVAIPTGVYLDVELDTWVDKPDLQVRLRSSLSTKKGLVMANGVGTIDIDYPGEIHVVVYNTRSEPVEINAFERIAQIVVGCRQALNCQTAGKVRSGGFGSTGEI